MTSQVSTSHRLEKLSESVKQVYNSNGDPSHDFLHIQRVVANCKKIGAAEGANLELLCAAALLHDIVNLPKDHPERSQASTRAAKVSQEILKKHEFSEDEIKKVTTIIEEHSFSAGIKPSCVESAILQDCDRLDSLGAIGLMRTVTCGTLMKASYYNNEEPIAQNRPLEDKKYTIDHFYTKLFKLCELMNFESSRQEARKRTDFMKLFVEQLRQEL